MGHDQRGGGGGKIRWQKSRSETASSEFSHTPSKLNSFGHIFALDRVAGTGQCGGTQRANDSRVYGNLASALHHA